MSTINVRGYKGPVRPDGTPIELPQKVLKLTKKANMRHKKPNRSRVGDFLVGLLLCLIFIMAVQFGQQKPLAGWLLVPYLLWVTFAGVLNFAVARLNP